MVICTVFCTYLKIYLQYPLLKICALSEQKHLHRKMDTIITSLEQVPAGLTLLFKKVDELTAKVNSQSNPQPTAPAPADQLHTRTETAKILRVTLATLNEYTKSGKIVGNRIGNRVLYKDSDIQAALSQIKTGNKL